MRNNIKYIFLSLFCIILSSIPVKSIKGGSVYAIPEHWPTEPGTCKINIYKIQDDGQLEYQQSYSLPKSGAGDVAIDSDSGKCFTNFP